MDFHLLKNEIENMSSWWHKLIFICNVESIVDRIVSLNSDIEVLNVNLILSESLVSVSKNKYPLYVEDVMQHKINNSSKIYLLQYIDILFDPDLQINSIRLLENISKRNNLIVIWPGVYKNGQLMYAESGHPEYYSNGNFEGKAITN
ncbi:virulence associated protein [Bacillus cereus]|uniref:BREX-3 system P-loop-containing protein BrxF n=1 Tax=Bacillus TaxID=1386 RepID=UPI000BECF3E1|nr:MULTISPECIES: BREX-3 system P-loop-containing protein BrxF [Bacillus]PED47024.1 virulence associated protein [Bacillus cereus]PFA00384.1 virulence associated protein [Bacillus cereus]PFP64786.1 virulence associated protein [Bacillus cereus]PFT90558.1 virulence associated protein [Bacillus cereus]PGL10246.1 virulence associated protein [Bacillus cereus]